MTGLEGLLAGRVLGGRYLIEEVIGRGGMGAVYRALDERLGRRVAVKIVTMPGGMEPDARERLRARFNREARAAAALPHHPNVVPVYDYGTDDALGLDYIIMELLRGSDLATRLARSGAPPLSTALRILQQAARGLAVGHRAGLIHRDVKPGNIFLAQSDHDEMQVRMVDFGIAKLADEEDTANALTQDGRAPHSPAFASPEQLRGLGQLTPASDVFSLGAVGYQLLTGERPFSDTDRNRMSLGMPVPPPPLRSRNPAIPGAVEAVIQQALAFDPQERFPNAAAFGAALDQAVRGLPDMPVEPYAAGAADHGPVGDDPTRLEHDDDRTQMMDEDDRTLLVPPAAPGPTAAPPATPPPPRAAADPEPQRRSAAPWIWAFVIIALAAVGVWAWSTTQDREQFVAEPIVEDTVVMDTAAQEDSAALAARQALEVNREGLQFFRQGNYADALISFRRAVDLDPTDPSYRRNLGLAFLKLNQAERAEQEFRQAIDLDPLRDVAYANLAEAQLLRGDTTGAIQSLERYLQLSRDARLRGWAAGQLQELRAQQATGGLLGVPLDTVTGQPDTVRISIPPSGGTPRPDTTRAPGEAEG